MVDTPEVLTGPGIIVVLNNLLGDFLRDLVDSFGVWLHVFGDRLTVCKRKWLIGHIHYILTNLFYSSQIFKISHEEKVSKINQSSSRLLFR